MARKGFTLAGVGIFITYLICMWMLAMVAHMQKMQNQILNDVAQLKQAIIQKQAIVVNDTITPEQAEVIISNIVEACETTTQK